MAINFCDLSSNVGSIGSCLVQQIFGGDIVFGGIIAIIGILILMIRFGLPFETIYPVSIALTFTLWIVSGSIVMGGLFLLTLVIAGGLLAYALFNYFRSW